MSDNVLNPWFTWECQRSCPKCRRCRRGTCACPGYTRWASAGRSSDTAAASRAGSPAGRGWWWRWTLEAGAGFDASPTAQQRKHSLVRKYGPGTNNIVFNMIDNLIIPTLLFIVNYYSLFCVHCSFIYIFIKLPRAIYFVLIDFICNALYISKYLKVLHSKSRLKTGVGITI